MNYNGILFIIIVCTILPTSARIAYIIGSKSSRDPIVWGIGCITGMIIGILAGTL